MRIYVASHASNLDCNKGDYYQVLQSEERTKEVSE